VAEEDGTVVPVPAEVDGVEPADELGMLVELGLVMAAVDGGTE
jgi:hypothetical protein